VGRFAVNPAKEADLERRMQRLGLKEEDMEEHFVRGSGPGGQHRNKTSTCVHLRHRASAVEVRYGENRSQSVNRFIARRILVERLEALAGISSPKTVRHEKKKKQKKRRARKARAKRLASEDPDSILGG